MQCKGLVSQYTCHVEYSLAGLWTAGGFVGREGGCVTWRRLRGHLVRHMHLYGVTGLPRVLVRQWVGARLAARKMSLHPLQHGEHWVRWWQPSLGRCLRDVRRRDAECSCHTFQRQHGVFISDVITSINNPNPLAPVQTESCPQDVDRCTTFVPLHWWTSF